MSIVAHESPKDVKIKAIKVGAIIKARKTEMDYYWLARNFDLSKRKPHQWFLKRCLDYIGSSLVLLLLSPILLSIAILIKHDSKGPVFFKQKRIGFYGKQFYMYKFRSMSQDAEKNLEILKQYNETNNQMFKMADDPRITKIGKFIRKYSLDEFPQLINVLRGEMSLVGPRPPLPKEVADYEPWHYLRFTTQPGLTGLWQVSGRSEIKSFSKVVKLDYDYVTNWNIGLDLCLLLKTIPVIIFAKGAS